MWPWDQGRVTEEVSLLEERKIRAPNHSPLLCLPILTKNSTIAPGRMSTVVGDLVDRILFSFKIAWSFSFDSIRLLGMGAMIAEINLLYPLAISKSERVFEP